MCVTFLALSSFDSSICNGKYKLVLLNNRDEEFSRQTTKLDWDGDILAGRDKDAQERGTWLAVNRNGDIGNLLSISEPAAVKEARGALPSRGRIVNDFLLRQSTLTEYCDDLVRVGDHYNGFQFLGLQRSASGFYELTSVTNRVVPKTVVQHWSPGIYGFGNSPTTHPFKKVVHGERRFKEIIDVFDAQSEEKFINELLRLATDSTSYYPDEQLRFQTGLSDSCYRPLCSLFVRFPQQSGIRYGTRSHSVVLVDKNDVVTFFERRIITFPADISEALWDTTIHHFSI